MQNMREGRGKENPQTKKKKSLKKDGRVPSGRQNQSTTEMITTNLSQAGFRSYVHIPLVIDNIHDTSFFS